MIELVFATNNSHKIFEVRQILGASFRILSLEDIPCRDELPETHETLEENSLEKASYIFERFHCNCFAEDTGLEIDALNGRPGVYSARYAGSARSSDANMRKVLRELSRSKDRGAQFRTVITLFLDGETQQFEGLVRGQITEKPSGSGGFGYDPIFQPQGYDLTFAEMPPGEKNRISHRAKAIQKLTAFLLER